MIKFEVRKLIRGCRDSQLLGIYDDFNDAEARRKRALSMQPKELFIIRKIVLNGAAVKTLAKAA